MVQPTPRTYSVHARSTDTFGRVLCDARDQHFVADGPVQNGCPGEAITPVELFLAGVASCGTELMQVLARDQQMTLRGVRVDIESVQDPAHPVRPDVSLFNTVHIAVALRGVSQEQGDALVAAFTRR